MVEAIGRLVEFAIVYGYPFFRDEVVPAFRDHVIPTVVSGFESLAQWFSGLFGQKPGESGDEAEKTSALAEAVEDRETQGTVEMTSEEYDRLMASAIADAVSLAARLDRLSSAKITDDPLRNPRPIDLPQFTRRISELVEERPELIHRFSREDIESGIVNSYARVRLLQGASDDTADAEANNARLSE